MKDIGYLAIEGVIGVGKTSLARRLARDIDARLVLETHDANPFIEDFYRDPAHYAFQTQMFFLLSRFQQQQELLQQDVFHPHTISDYIFAKDKIFAYLNLEDRELKLYEQVSSTLEKNITKPDLIIYLQSTLDRLMKNIRRRGRSYEKYITEEYLEALMEAYNHFFFHYYESPLLVVNATNLDFVKREEDLNTLKEQIDNHPGGVVFFNPMIV
ncbi:deoxynucleoside kinase [candidate division LCP-89 bacterium B3_LCP]|uniref:Deoxynucleoside kinase n=1 Tax=candidate division LCP-89 bacterium B3_LCP TaxID=2012998 RepID=A0A532V250_UNCL8|nr:MAG: deoxynucleoside kinase [candidate division LCP-89 bacterium B3_LCP]